MTRYFFPFLAITLALASCARLAEKKEEKPAPFGPSGIPPILRSKGAKPDPGTPILPGGNVVPGGNVTPSATGATPAAPGKPASGAQFTPEDDLVFTDPDNPEAGLPELGSLLDAPKKRGPWEESETIARQRSVREGKAELIWFTDSKTSPMCKALDQELFSKPDFQKWATEKLVRLRVDSCVRSSKFVNDESISLDEKATRLSDVGSYVTELKKRYKVLGHPTLLVLNPSGEVIGRYRGYKRGQRDFTWGLIKQSEAVSANFYQGWRKNMEKKGYREWNDRKDRKIFAKLTSYSKGTLTLIDPDGIRCKTTESKLSDKDRAWIAEQKKLRGIQ